MPLLKRHLKDILLVYCPVISLTPPSIDGQKSTSRDSPKVQEDSPNLTKVSQPSNAAWDQIDECPPTLRYNREVARCAQDHGITIANDIHWDGCHDRCSRNWPLLFMPCRFIGKMSTISPAKESNWHRPHDKAYLVKSCIGYRFGKDATLHYVAHVVRCWVFSR